MLEKADIDRLVGETRCVRVTYARGGPGLDQRYRRADFSYLAAALR